MINNIDFKAILFDMDGVITNTMPDHYRSWVKIFHQEGIHVSHLDIYRREGQPGINSVLEIFQENQRLISKKKALRILRKKEILFKKIAKRRFIAGARNFIKSLKKDKFQLALVTGTSRHELRRILPQKLINVFEVIITGNDVRRGKPDPEPYKKALKMLKVLPRQAVVIENAPFGIQSAKNAKIRCLAVKTSLHQRYLREAQEIFLNINDLRNKVTFLRV